MADDGELLAPPLFLEEKRTRERALEPLRREEEEVAAGGLLLRGLPYIQLLGSQWDFTWKKATKTEVCGLLLWKKNKK